VPFNKEIFAPKFCHNNTHPQTCISIFQ